MSVPVNQTDQVVEAIPNPTATPNLTVNLSNTRTVKVNNISVSATEKDVKEFFSFSGDVQYVELQRESESSQMAYVTFKDSHGAETAALLTGSNIANVSVTITPVENYQLPSEAVLPSSPAKTSVAFKKAEDVMSTMLAKGFILGKGAVIRAKSFDERHRLTSNASATVASLDRRMGLSGKLSVGTTIVNEKVRVVDEKFQVSEKTKSAIAVAEQKASSAGSAIMSNPYVSSGAQWVSNAFTAVAKAAEGVGTLTKEKVEQAEVEKKEIIVSETEKKETNASETEKKETNIVSETEKKDTNVVSETEKKETNIASETEKKESIVNEKKETIGELEKVENREPDSVKATPEVAANSSDDKKLATIKGKNGGFKDCEVRCGEDGKVKKEKKESE
ncbi:hypothetical protein RJT34_04846 [Clitoria ternatea]|uniref:RRM domain-containing protein n=1 Tax=Clitoria ternatea TaxID=43366 RepID=A0AAN9KMD2_CLITE